MNFFDHTKVILDYAADLMIYVDKDRASSSFALKDIEGHTNPFVPHCHPYYCLIDCRAMTDLISRLTYTSEVVEHMMKSSTAAPDAQ